MSSIITALVYAASLMLQIALTITGVILAWFIVFYALGAVLVGANAWLKSKRRQNVYRIYRGPTIDL